MAYRTPENNNSNEAIKHHQVVTSTLQSKGRGFTPFFLNFFLNLHADDTASGSGFNYGGDDVLSCILAGQSPKKISLQSIKERRKTRG